MKTLVLALIAVREMDRKREEALINSSMAAVPVSILGLYVYGDRTSTHHTISTRKF
jgi:hypothetical protein